MKDVGRETGRAAKPGKWETRARHCGIDPHSSSEVPQENGALVAYSTNLLFYAYSITFFAFPVSLSPLSYLSFQGLSLPKKTTCTQAFVSGCLLEGTQIKTGSFRSK